MSFFFFNDTATTEIYTLSLHDALPIYMPRVLLGKDVVGNHNGVIPVGHEQWHQALEEGRLDRKSTRLNSSHANISYAVFCLKKKKPTSNQSTPILPT